jgi:hypothetical protein
MKKVKMGMSFDDEETDYSLSAEFSDDDISHLTAYRAHVKELRDTHLIKTNWPSEVKCHWTPETGTAVLADEIDEEYISSFLHRLRPLILTEEPASFDKTAGLIGRRFADKAMKKHLKGVRALYETSRFSSYGQMHIADVPIFDQETMKKWLNAYGYHQDTDKRESLRFVEGEFGRKGARTVFVLQLPERSATFTKTTI